MTSNARKAARSGSTARKQTAQRRTPPKPRGQAKHEEELQITLDHRQRIDTEFSQVMAQIQQLEARRDELKLQAHQALGREQMLRELRGEAPPLPPVALMGQQPQASENGDSPQGEEPKDKPPG